MCVFSPLLAAAVIAVLLMAAHMLPLGWGAILAIALGAVLCAANVYMLRDRFQVDAGGEGYTIKAMRRVLGGDAEYYSPPNRTRNPSESGICLTASGHRPGICSWLSFFACIYICWRGSWEASYRPKWRNSLFDVWSTALCFDVDPILALFLSEVQILL